MKLVNECKKLNLNDFYALLQDTLAKCMEESIHVGDLEISDFELLLKDESDIEVETLPYELPLPALFSNKNGEMRKDCYGYPMYPLYKNLAAVMSDWLRTSRCPRENMPPVGPFVDEPNFISTLKVTCREVLELLKGLESLWDSWNNEERIGRMMLILSILKKRGILSLLGLRKTVGSVDIWPPLAKTLITSFDRPISTTVPLSEGARAISKHFLRDETSKFWGSCKGNEMQKTKESHQKIIDVLNNAVWINIHELPGHLPVIEVRESQGYGARWLADGSEFRGLLEPHMVDGHEVGWKH